MNNYFPHDSNSRNSDKLLPVRMKYGAEGYGIYFMILERLREEKNYMSVKDYNMLAFDLRVDTSKVKDVVENFGLFAFTDDGECFYSEGFNKRMEIKDEKSKKRSEAGKKGAEKRWQKNSTANGNANSKAMAMPSNSDSKESKVKESKVKESKVNKNNNSPRIFSYLESNGFGSPYGNTMYESVLYWFNDLEEKGLSEEKADEWLILGVDEAVRQNVRRMKFVESIWRNRINANLLTPEAIEGDEVRRQSRQSGRGNSNKNARKENLPYWAQPDYSYEEYAAMTPEQREERGWV